MEIVYGYRRRAQEHSYYDYVVEKKMAAAVQPANNLSTGIIKTDQNFRFSGGSLVKFIEPRELLYAHGIAQNVFLLHNRLYTLRQYGGALTSTRSC